MLQELLNDVYKFKLRLIGTNNSLGIENSLGNSPITQLDKQIFDDTLQHLHNLESEIQSKIGA